MQRDFGISFVTQCAPVMAGLKPANLFRWVEPDGAALRRTLAAWQDALRPRGVEIAVLKSCTRAKAHLIYVYRAPRLQKILQDPEVLRFLQGSGYPEGEDLAAHLSHLSKRLCCEETFPHEIGVFLGYPLEDVVGFMVNKGKNYTCKGYWKVYGDPIQAEARFASFRKCTEVYLRCYRSGTPVTRLTIAV